MHSSSFGSRSRKAAIAQPRDLLFDVAAAPRPRAEVGVAGTSDVLCVHEWADGDEPGDEDKQAQNADDELRHNHEKCRL